MFGASSLDRFFDNIVRRHRACVELVAYIHGFI